MTIRSGGRPRDGRATQARPYDQDAYATETVPEYSEPVPRGRDGRGGRSGGGLSGLLKFLIFALVLAAVVLAVALTALRPMVTGQPGRTAGALRTRHRGRKPRDRADRAGLG